MCRKWVLIISSILLLGMVGTASPDDVTWIGDPGDPNAKLSFCNPGAWDGGAVPGSADTVYINPPPYQGPVVDCSATVGDILGPRHNSDANQVMDFVSGTFTAVSWKIGQTGSGTSTINMGGDSIINIPGIDWDDGIQGPWGNGTIVMNVTDNAQLTSKRAEYGLHMCRGAATKVVMNISGNANITGGGTRGWRFADEGTAIINISGDPRIVIGGKWRNGDSDRGYIEIHMSGGYLSVDGFLSVYDDGSCLFDFNGGTVQVGGLLFKGRECTSAGEINISGTADITVWEAIRLSTGGCGPSTLNISGGRLYTDWVMEMAHGAATSTLNMTGGSLVVKRTFTAPFAETAKAIINLDGGTIECGSFSHGGDNWLLDICGGTMVIDGNVMPEIETDVAIGKITACGGSIGYSVVADFNNVNPGKTTIWAESGPLPSDFDGNGTVEWADLKILNQWWLSRCRVGEWCDGCDLNQSGAIDFKDFALFALDWLKTWK